MLESTRTVAEIVLDHPELAEVFQRHHIDFCCHGDVPLDEAVRARGIDPGVVQDELSRAIGQAPRAKTDPRALDNEALVALIIDRFHKPLRKLLGLLPGLSNKVAEVHADHDPRLRQVARLIDRAADQLIPHLAEEENGLFPLLLSASPDSLDVEERLRNMVADHLALAPLLEMLRALTDDFSAPDWACSSLELTYRKSAELVSETLQHVHLENHLLAPRFRPGGALFGR